MFKKTAIAAIVLGFSGAASAAMYAPAPAPACAAGNVTVPCERSAWDLGVDALYLRSETNSLSGVPGLARAKFGWGFRLEGSYHFGTGNDANLNWSHFDKRNVVGFGASLKTKFDTVNFELGQVVNFGENFDMRFQAGVQYFTTTDHQTVTAGGANIVNTEMTGFGPRVGSKVTYNFGNGFGTYVDANVAFAVTSMDMTMAPLAKVTTYGTAVSTDASVGVAYTYAMAQGDLTARLGWGVTRVATTASWSGVNFGLKWVGNA